MVSRPARPITPTLGEIARITGSRLDGDPDLTITAVAPLEEAGPESISFLANPKYHSALTRTRAAAVFLPPGTEGVPSRVAALFTETPYLAFAQAVRALHPPRQAVAGVSHSAEVDPTAVIHPSAEVSSRVYVGPGAQIGARCILDPGVVVEAEAQIGEGCHIGANVCIRGRSQLGDRVRVNPGAVIGGEGFGFAPNGERWEAVPQLGRVVIGDDVDIGANTTIDRGSQVDTVIGNGCKIDNLVQIAHNVELGDHTVVAACSGIAGSTRIGRCCTIAGAVGVAGHLEIAPGTTFTGMAMVTGSVPRSGIYSSGIPAMPARDWRRNAVRFRQLDTMAKRIDALEKALERMMNESESNP